MTIKQFPPIEEKIRSFRVKDLSSYRSSLFFNGITMLISFAIMLLGIKIVAQSTTLDLGNIAIVFFSLLFFIYYLYLFFLHFKHKRQCHNTIEKLSEQELSLLSSECSSATDFESFALCRDFLIARTLCGPVILRNQDIAWIYVINTEKRLNGFYNGNEYCIVCGTIDTQKFYIYRISGRDGESRVQEIIRILYQHFYQYRIRFGYSKELDRLFEFDINDFFAYGSKDYTPPKHFL